MEVRSLPPAGLHRKTRATVYQWRRKRTGPCGFRVGRHLRFDPDDVRAWVDSRRSEAAA
ncbi:helix-turn-helix domain-containing protein [Streptomyces sp. NPDC049970]|uniref:helix-turn-helix transcriptional regulator n=1 Tax=Streptomyces sp. NPDC049970 TaxID=3155033 RepID=UPI003434E007